VRGQSNAGDASLFTKEQTRLDRALDNANMGKAGYIRRQVDFPKQRNSCHDDLGKEQGLMAPKSRSLVKAAKRAGLVGVERSPSHNLVRVWLAAELRDGPADYNQLLLEAIGLCCFDGVIGRGMLVVLDAQNPDLELGRFLWIGGLSAI